MRIWATELWVCAHMCVWVCVVERGALTPVKSLDFLAPLSPPAVSTAPSPPPSRTVGQQAVGRLCQEPGFSPSRWDWLAVCVSLDGGSRGRLYPSPQSLLCGIQMTPLHPLTPTTTTTFNHALSKQTAGVRGKAISTGLLCLLTGGLVVPENWY